MRHKVDIETLESDGYSFGNIIASSHGKGDSKTLTVLVDVLPMQSISYQVITHGVEAYAGPSLRDAVNIYNDC